MKRHLVMDLYYGNKTEVVDGPWNDVEKLPDCSKCKVKVKLINKSERFAYFYLDKAHFILPLGVLSYFWDCQTKEPLENVTHWKYIKDDQNETTPS